MIATGVAFALVHDFALLLVVAFAGTINPRREASASSCLWSMQC